MSCEACSVACQRFGRHRNGLRRFRCPQCKRTYTEPHTRVLDSMYISQDRAALALQLLLEGNSIRSTERICGIDRNTIMSLIIKAGDRCKTLMISKIVSLPVNDVQADEIWGFVQKKEGHKRDHEKNSPGIGDAYCFVGIERHSKLILAWHLGKRDQRSTDTFIGKLRYATDGCRYQFTTDGFKPYISAVKLYLKGIVDFAQLVKVYSAPREGEQRYSPGDVVEAVPVPIMGLPKRHRICTSHIERQNLSIRMGMRRRVHASLRVTPCMEVGIENHIWTIAELIA